MRLLRGLACSFLLGAGVLAVPYLLAPAPAQAEDQQVIAVIDVQQVLQEASAIKAMQSQVEGLRISFQADFTQKERALREKNQALENQRSTLPADEFSQKRLDLEAEVMFAQQDFKERKARLDRMLSLALGRVQNKLTEVVRDLAEERGADLVLAKSTVVLVNTDMEITTEALSRLNEQLPIIPLSDLGE